MTSEADQREQILIDMLRFRKPELRIMIGGAAVSEHHAIRWGADGYAPNALCALQAAIRLLSSPREIGYRSVVATI